MSKYKNIIDQCELAIKSVENILTLDEFQECMDYIHQYNEWLLALEFAIDWIVEEDRKITEESYRKFAEAYKLMKLKSKRLQHLKLQIINIDN